MVAQFHFHFLYLINFPFVSVPFTGEKAIAILQLHYTSNKASGQAAAKKPMPLQRLVNEEQEQKHLPSTFLSSPVVDPSRVFKFMDIDVVSSDHHSQHIVADQHDTLKAPSHHHEKMIHTSGINTLASIAESFEYDHPTPQRRPHQMSSSVADIAPAAELEVCDMMQVDDNQDEKASVAIHAHPLSPQPPFQESRKRGRDLLSSSELTSTTATPYRKRIPMTLQTDTETILTILRITLDHTTTRASLQTMVKSFLEGRYWEEEEWDSLEPEDAKSICWFGRDGIAHEFDALDDDSVWRVEGLVIQV